MKHYVCMYMYMYMYVYIMYMCDVMVQCNFSAGIL